MTHYPAIPLPRAAVGNGAITWGASAAGSAVQLSTYSIAAPAIRVTAADLSAAYQTYGDGIAIAMSNVASPIEAAADLFNIPLTRSIVMATRGFSHIHIRRNVNASTDGVAGIHGLSDYTDRELHMTIPPIAAGTVTNVTTSGSTNTAIPTLGTGERPKEILVSVLGAALSDSALIMLTSNASEAGSPACIVPQGDIIRLRCGGMTHLRHVKGGANEVDISIAALA
jgi:hypothetical protein